MLNLKEIIVGTRRGIRNEDKSGTTAEACGQEEPEDLEE